MGDYYENGRHTIFEASLNINGSSVNLNAIYEFNGLNDTVLYGYNDGTRDYLYNGSTTNLFENGTLYDSGNFTSWEKRNNIYYKELLQFQDDQSNYFFAIAFNVYKSKQ